MENLQEKVTLLEKAVSDERRRLSSDRLDISFGELINLYKNDDFDYKALRETHHVAD